MGKFLLIHREDTVIFVSQKMDSDDIQQIKKCHVVAMPYPGRGHINPMLNLSILIATKRPDYVITFIVTEEWAEILGSESKPSNFRFSTIPNVIPSERGRAADFAGFYKAALTKLEEPVEQLLDELEMPVSVIIYDTNLVWVVGLGNRNNIPVASLWTMSATMFSTSYFSDLLFQNGHLPLTLKDTKTREELVSCIPGIPPTPILDLVITPFYGKGSEILPEFKHAISLVTNAQYLLIASIYELESQVIDALKQHLHIPVYTIGPVIPYFKINENFGLNANKIECVDWLNAQPESSVLYISQGSFLSTSSAQLNEIVAGVHQSGVRFIWVARADNSFFKGGVGDKGLVVPWCDQLNVLCHSSIGGFWSHCGWNSTKEGLFSGVPILTLPLLFDQIPNSRMIVNDWKIGLNVKEDWGDETLVDRNEIARLIKRFMDLESEDGKEMRKRAQELKEICRQVTLKDGSSDIDLEAFIDHILIINTGT